MSGRGTTYPPLMALRRLLSVGDLEGSCSDSPRSSEAAVMRGGRATSLLLTAADAACRGTRHMVLVVHSAEGSC